MSPTCTDCSLPALPAGCALDGAVVTVCSEHDASATAIAAPTRRLRIPPPSRNSIVLLGAISWQADAADAGSPMMLGRCHHSHPPHEALGRPWTFACGGSSLTG